MDLMSILQHKSDSFPTFNGTNFSEWKSKIFALLSSPEWHQKYLQQTESPPYATLSICLYKGLIQCLMGNALLLYLSDLPKFQGQGIHLLHHIIETNEPSSSSALITLFLKWSTLAQGPTESIDRFCSQV